MAGFQDIADSAASLLPPTDGLRARPSRLDVAVATLIAVGALIEFPFLTSPHLGYALASSLVLAAASALRRVRPLLVVVITATTVVGSDLLAAVTDEPFIGTVAGGLAALVILYSVGRWANARTVGASVMLACLLLPVTGLLNPEDGPAWVSFLIDVSIPASAIGVGVLVRSQQAMRDHKARAELAEERTNLAANIHDSVAHHMSAIAVRAEGARQLTDPTQTAQALDAIKQSADTGLTEMRHLVSSIRNTNTDPKHLPWLGRTQTARSGFDK